MRATLADTVAYLLALGFIPVADCRCYASPGADTTGSDFDVDIYLCRAGYYCVSIDGGYQAPIVWDGEQLPEVVEWLDTHHAGWRG